MSTNAASSDALERLVYAIVDCDKYDADAALSLAHRVVGSQIGANSAGASGVGGGNIDDGRTMKDLTSAWRRIERKSTQDVNCLTFVQNQYKRLERNLPDHQHVPPQLLIVLSKVINKQIHASTSTKSRVMAKNHLQSLYSQQQQQQQQPQHHQQQQKKQHQATPTHQQTWAASTPSQPRNIQPEPDSNDLAQAMSQMQIGDSKDQRTMGNVISINSSAGNTSMSISANTPHQQPQQQQQQPQHAFPSRSMEHHTNLEPGNEQNHPPIVSTPISMSASMSASSLSNASGIKKGTSSLPDMPTEERMEEIKHDIHKEERKILQECLYSLQGIDGECIRFYKRDAIPAGGEFCQYYDGVRVQSSAATSQSLLYSGHMRHTRLGTGAIDAIKICGEAGWLYQKIQEYIQLVHGDELKGVIARAFCGTLVNQLRDYHSLLSSFEARLFATENGEAQMTLRHLLIELRGPTHRLKNLTMLTNSVERLSGGFLLTALYRHSMHGDSRHVDTVNRLLRASSLPWFEMLYLWTTQGVLSDPHNEFFVRANENSNEVDFWHERYEVVLSRVPTGILDTALIQPAFNVGKGINFIRKCLQDSTWSMELDTADDAQPTKPGTAHKAKALGYFFDQTLNRNNKLETTLTQATAIVHSHILESLRANHNLLDHLFGIKQFLFMGQGDFFSALMDGLHAEFNGAKRQSAIYKHSLLSIVESALRNTNAKYLPANVLDRLQVELVMDPGLSMDGDINGRQTPSPTVWDIFMLDYTVPDPIVAIVHNAALDKYKVVFSLLFRLRRAEYMLNHTWRQSAILHHALHTAAHFKGLNQSNSAEYAQAVALLRNMSITRQAMMHFIVNFKSYIMFEVIEGGWKQIKLEMDAANTLDDMIAAHDRYLAKITRKCLLGMDAAPGDDVNTSTISTGNANNNDLGLALQDLLQTVIDFCVFQEAVLEEALVQTDIVTEKRLHAQYRVNQGQWGFESENDIAEEREFFGMANLAHLEHVVQSNEVFNGKMFQLVHLLTEQINSNPVDRFTAGTTDAWVDTASAIDDDLDLQRFLTSQLDHNGFYSMQEVGHGQ